MRNFPIERSEQYGVTGTVMALTAAHLGAPVTAADYDRWSNTMARLALADDISESDTPLDVTGYLKILDLPADQPDFIKVMTGLTQANDEALQAPTMRQYYQARGDEAWYTISLLRHASSSGLAQNGRLWHQLGSVAELSIYFDNLVDCHSDAATVVTQFSPGQLALGALYHMRQPARQIRPRTYIACLRACRETGLGTELQKKIF